MTEPEWRRVREGLGSLGVIAAKHHIERSRLAWRFEASKKGTDLYVREDEVSATPLSYLDELVRLFDTVLEAAQAEGIEIRPYKPLEAEAIVVALEMALRQADEALEAFVGHLLHELIWAQGLPNANHRTTFALAERIIRERTGKATDARHAVAVAERFASKSKPLIVEKEFQPDHSAVKARHLEEALEHARRLLHQH